MNKSNVSGTDAGLNGAVSPLDGIMGSTKFSTIKSCSSGERLENGSIFLEDEIGGFKELLVFLLMW